MEDTVQAAEARHGRPLLLRGGPGVAQHHLPRHTHHLCHHRPRRGLSATPGSGAGDAEGVLRYKDFYYRKKLSFIVRLFFEYCTMRNVHDFILIVVL